MKFGGGLVLKLNDQLLLELLSYKFILGSSRKKSKGSYLMFWLLKHQKTVSHLLTMLKINYLLEAMDRRWDWTCFF